MRQNMQEREKQIRRLHESIDKYQQSPNTKKAVQHATTQLIKAIEYKYNKSQINAHYRFPKNIDTSTESDEDDIGYSEIVDLKMQNDFLSQELSVAEEAQSNFVYVSEKMVLMADKDKGDGFSKRKTDKGDNKSRLKIKVIKKKKQQNTLQTTQKLDRLKTQHINTNFSTQSYKNEQRTSTNEHSSSKSRLVLYPPLSDITRLRQKLKIASRLESDNSPHPNITIKTEYSYTNCTKRKSGKENQRLTMNPHASVSLHEKDKEKDKDRYYFGQNHAHASSTHKKIDMSNYRLQLHIGGNVASTKNLLKKHINVSSNFSHVSNSISTCNLKALKQNVEVDRMGEHTPKPNNQKRSKKLCHKSFESLKSIRLGNKSSQKLKSKGIHA